MCRCRVSHYLAQDGMTFSIFFGGDRPSVEYEADSLEEKNEIFRMLTLIINNNRANRKVRECAWMCIVWRGHANASLYGCVYRCARHM